MRAQDRRTTSLSGAKMLIVDDEFMIAFDLEFILRDAGAGMVTICTSAEEALEAVERDGFDVAVLDVRLGADSSEAVARALSEHNVPIVFHSGQPLPAAMRQRHPDAVVLAKPTTHTAIVEAVCQQLAEGPEPRGLKQ